MKKVATWLALLALTLAACGPSAPAPDVEPAAATDTRRAPLPTATAEPPTEPPAPSPIPSPTPILTETPLPPLALPSPQPDAPASQVWDGPPTYPAESVPGLYFRLSFDPAVWALTQDQFGQSVLGHRGIPYCVIAPVSGRGLPLDWRVDHEMRQLGPLVFDVGLAYENDRLRFATYLGGDGQVFTGFEVRFDQDAETCLADAEAVMGTLTSVPEAEATQIP